MCGSPRPIRARTSDASVPQRYTTWSMCYAGIKAETFTLPTPCVTTVSTQKRLSGIEALRGIAATAVVFSHAARHVDKAFGAPGLITAFQAGHAGVDLFFVLSGFIILFVHRRDIGQPGRLQHYLGRRFNRVMPLYWLVLALTIGMSVAGRHDAPSLPWLLWSAALLPSLSEPLLGIAWTLQFEVVFYAAFAVLIVSRGAGLALLAVWFAWIVAAALGLDSTGVPGSLCGFSDSKWLLTVVGFVVSGGVVHVLDGASGHPCGWRALGVRGLP